MISLDFRDVLPSVEPGYLCKLLPTEAPEEPENWKDVMEDLKKFILPGITHWNSPNFHAYYPTGNSYPSMVAEIIANGFGLIGINWLASPASAELEVIMMDWLARLFGLPDHFLNSSAGRGGGAIQSSASESCLVALITGRELAVQRYRREHPEMSESDVRGKLVAYSSDQSNSCIEKASILAAVPIRLLSTAGSECALQGETLRAAVEEDLAKGLIPCIVLATLGTTQTCAFDNLLEIGPICEQFEMWLHVDAAYAGASFCCEEYREVMEGIEYADSLNINMHKWLMINFDCCAMWLRDSTLILKAMRVDRIYLSHQFTIDKAIEHRHWNIALGRRMRSLKVWFTLRIMGAENIRMRIRQHVGFAKVFEGLVKNDPRFELVGKAVLGLVVFRLKSGCDKTKELLDRITMKKKIYMIAGHVAGKYAIRYVIAGMESEERDTLYAWDQIMDSMNDLEKGVQFEVAMESKDEPMKEDHGILEVMAEQLEKITIEDNGQIV